MPGKAAIADGWMQNQAGKKRRGNPGFPIVVLVAVDEYVTSQKLEQIRQKVLDREHDETGCLNISGVGTDFEDIAMELATPSLFSAQKLVIVSEADGLLQHQADKIIAWLENPQIAGCLVLIVSSFDARKKVSKALAKAGSVVRCDRLSPRDVPAWATARARHYGKGLDPEAQALLVAIAGDDMGHIDAELAKLAVYVGSRPKIAAQDVQVLAVGSHSFKPWDLTDAIGAGNREKAMAVTQSMLDEGANEIVMVAMLGRYLEDLIAARTEPARLERIPSQFVRDKLAQQARKFTLDKLKTMYAFVYQADVELKSSPLAPRTAVETLVARLAS